MNDIERIDKRCDALNAAFQAVDKARRELSIRYEKSINEMDMRVQKLYLRMHENPIGVSYCCSLMKSSAESDGGVVAATFKSRRGVTIDHIFVDKVKGTFCPFCGTDFNC